MGLNAITAPPLAAARMLTDMPGGLFLLQIATLTASSTWLGLRALKAKDLGSVKRWRAERATSAALIAASLGGLVFGVTQSAQLFLAFGGLGLMQGVAWWRFFGEPGRERMGWFLMHMSGMCGSAIGAITAFAVINAKHLGVPHSLQWVAWVAPGAVLGTGLTLWGRGYRSKFQRAEVARARTMPEPSAAQSAVVASH